MHELTTPKDMRAWSRAERARERRVGFVPTMGALHEGHLRLIDRAKERTDSVVAGCSAITDVLKSLRVKTCGYSGLMLPVLEDPVLARRASEGRYSVRDLLLYSTVCGTGLDVVPLPGDTAADRLAVLIADVAALSSKLRKPLAARLFPVPGKAAGERAHYDDPYLTDCVVMKAE